MSRLRKLLKGHPKATLLAIAATVVDHFPERWPTRYCWDPPRQPSKTELLEVLDTPFFKEAVDSFFASKITTQVNEPAVNSSEDPDPCETQNRSLDLVSAEHQDDLSTQRTSSRGHEVATREHSPNTPLVSLPIIDKRSTSASSKSTPTDLRIQLASVESDPHEILAKLLQLGIIKEGPCRLSLGSISGVSALFKPLFDINSLGSIVTIAKRKVQIDNTTGIFMLDSLASFTDLDEPNNLLHPSSSGQNGAESMQDIAERFAVSKPDINATLQYLKTVRGKRARTEQDHVTHAKAIVSILEQLKKWELEQTSGYRIQSTCRVLQAVVSRSQATISWAKKVMTVVKAYGEGSLHPDSLIVERINASEASSKECFLRFLWARYKDLRAAELVSQDTGNLRLTPFIHGHTHGTQGQSRQQEYYFPII